MLRSTLLGALFVSAWLALGAAVAWNADGARWSATLLFAEPALLVLAALVGVGLGGRGGGLPLIGWVLGVASFFLLVRVPRTGSSQVGGTPRWVADAEQCAEELDLSASPFRLLQWTLDPGVPDEVISDVVRRSQADVVLLFDVPREGVDARVDEILGGESALVGAGAPMLLATRGVLHPCGEATVLAAPGGLGHHAMAFVGAYEGVSFPLLFGEMPALSSPDWTQQTRDARLALGSIVGALQSSKLVVALDSHGPWTWTRLNARLAAVGMRLAWSSPDWPRRVGPMPWLPMHAMQRLWTGSAWRPGEAAVLRAGAGERAPVLHVVDAAVRSSAR